MKLSRFIVLNELTFPKRSAPDKEFPVNPRGEEEEQTRARTAVGAADPLERYHRVVKITGALRLNQN